MANGATHTFVGGLSGLLVALCNQDDDSIAKPVAGTTLGVVFGKLPDVLEPATNPHHRQFCHSFLVFSAVGYGVKKVYDWKSKNKLEEFIRLGLLCAGAGYISHLF
tara:strand:+ start:1107 stop:1424 length:318 start_codon:yes stop_codon:yes gene_type:complete